LNDLFGPTPRLLLIRRGDQHFLDRFKVQWFLTFPRAFLSAHFLSSKAHKGVMGLGRRLWALKVNPGQEARWENWRGWLMADGCWRMGNQRTLRSQPVSRTRAANR